jgi:hypothetical protein
MEKHHFLGLLPRDDHDDKPMMLGKKENAD